MNWAKAAADLAKIVVEVCVKFANNAAKMWANAAEDAVKAAKIVVEIAKIVVEIAPKSAKNVWKGIMKWFIKTKTRTQTRPL